MKNRPWGEAFRTTVVCIDAWDDNVPSGRFYNPCLPEGRAFGSLMEFLQEMEQTLDRMDYPSAYADPRCFSHGPTPLQGIPSPGHPTGKLATFVLRILFRRNVSWQGSISWVEGEQEQHFRSALELVLLLNNALSC